MKKYLLFCLRHFPEILCDATKGAAIFQVGDYTPPTRQPEVEVLTKHHFLLQLFLVSCYNVTVNPEIEIPQLSQEFFQIVYKVCLLYWSHFISRQEKIKSDFFSLNK